MVRRSQNLKQASLFLQEKKLAAKRKEIRGQKEGNSRRKFNASLVQRV
jgi:hypothetical protein